jgi:uncharacterized membrane-anchored protein YitT (DUF2179 family)
MRKVGRVYSADVSARFLLFFFLFMLVFTVASIIVINRFVDLYFENSASAADRAPVPQPQRIPSSSPRSSTSTRPWSAN